jgi:hypothetical protein
MVWRNIIEHVRAIIDVDIIGCEQIGREDSGNSAVAATKVFIRRDFEVDVLSMKSSKDELAYTHALLGYVPGDVEKLNVTVSFRELQFVHGLFDN